MLIRKKQKTTNVDKRILFYNLFILEVGLTTPFIPLFVPITPSSFRLRNRCKEWVHKGGGVRLNFANRHNYGLVTTGLMILSVNLDKIIRNKQMLTCQEEAGSNSQKRMRIKTAKKTCLPSEDGIPFSFRYFINKPHLLNCR
jgi:hypothetical protein